MNLRRFRFVAFLLVAILLLGGVAGCQREASVRVAEGETSATQGASTTGGGSTMPTATGSGLISPAGGVTVISALTPTAAGGVAGTQEPATSVTITTTVELPTAVAIQPVATQTPSASEGYTLYTVQLGDTLTAIASRYGTTLEAISSANNLTDPSTIFVGQVLKIPASGATGTEPSSSGECRYYHAVLPGEWIWQIARDYGVDPYAILQANGLTIESGNTISAGDRLCIP
jgi:LysM repeat protein